MRRHVYYYTHLEAPYAAAAKLLRADPAEWLPLPAEANGEGWLVRLRADGALPPPVASHDAEVRIGAVDEHGEELLRSLAWQSRAADRLVPVLEADLELASLDGYGCQLSMMGSYRPPLSVIGEAGDRLFGRRVAEACVRRFVLDVAERLGTATLPV